MKATLSFDLEDPDDKINHLQCVKATKMAIILFEIRHNLKKKCANRIEFKKPNEDEYDIIFDEIDKLFDEYNVDDILI